MSCAVMRFGPHCIRTLTKSTNSSRTRTVSQLSNAKKFSERPVKFTTSEANVGYRSTLNFYDDTPNDRPPSDNAAIAFSGIFGFVYMFLLRDDIDNDGGVNLIKPIHELYPKLGIPMIEAAIEQHRTLGYSTVALEKKLKEFKMDPEKYGGRRERRNADNSPSQR